MTYPYKLPYPNLLSSELLATGNTMALLTYDNTLFDDMELPQGIERDSVVNCILEIHGHATLYHPDPVYLKRAIKAWSKRKTPIWAKLLATTTVEYNPIHNYDRTERITEITTDTRKTSESGTTDTNTTTDSEGASSSSAKTEGTSRHDVSAENTSDYQPENQDISNNTSEGATNSSDSVNTDSSTTEKRTSQDDYTRSWTRENKTAGNIGVTTTQQMLQSERELVMYSVIEEIAHDYHRTFCLDIY